MLDHPIDKNTPENLPQAVVRLPQVRNAHYAEKCDRYPHYEIIMTVILHYPRP